MTKKVDPISTRLRLGRARKKLLLKYNVTDLRKIPPQTLLEESPELHADVYGGRSYDR